ncbi:hypothetical protein LA6_001895 [Marinibacterium anthonyi]|nr:hypothetical protein LA6_001895 [Marinibacterium anthonyi]
MNHIGAAALLALLTALPAAGQAEDQAQNHTQNQTQSQNQNQTALLFDTAHLNAVEAGSTLDYDVHAIRTDPDSGAVSETDGTIELLASAGAEPQRRTIEAVLTRDGHSRTLDQFQSVQGNPVVIIFLEQVLQDLARETGGSSQYLRKRLRDGLGAGLSAETVHGGTRLVMHPLVDDPNQAELGDYANLEVTFFLSDMLPGMVGSMTAVAGPDAAPVFLEEVTFDAKS